MANKKVTALTENTGPASEDLLYSVDDPSGTPASRKVTVQNLLQVIPTRTVNTTPATSDYVVIIDDPAGSPTVQHITIENLLKGILTSTGDILYRNSGGTITSLALGSPTNSLAVNSGGNGLEWVAGASGGGGAASMINNSGGTVAADSIVILDTSGTAYFTTSTIDHDTRVVGVVGASVNPGGTASVQTGIGRMDALVTGSIDIGDWLVHSGTAGHLKRYGPYKPVKGGTGISLESNTSGTATIAIVLHTDPWYTGSNDIGYAVAGHTGAAYTDTVIKKDISSGTWTSLGSQWARAIGEMGTGGNDTKGYGAHGYDGSYRAYLDKFTYATETGAAATSISGSKRTAGLSGGDLSTYAYVSGGLNAYTTWNVLAYATDTQSTTKTVTGNDWPAPTSYIPDATGGKSYQAGNYYSSTYRTNVYYTDHSTQTPVNSNNIPVGTCRMGGFLDDYNNEEYCYWFGGEQSGVGNAAVCYQLEISTDTMASSGSMNTAQDMPSGISGATVGISFSHFDTATTTSETFTFATETWSASDALPSAREASGGLSVVG